jgi:hypothetical protein
LDKGKLPHKTAITTFKRKGHEPEGNTGSVFINQKKIKI